MNKNSPMFQKKTVSRVSAQLHPVWRGIGFILIILLPALGYGLTLVFLDMNAKNGWFPVPAEFLIYRWGLDPMILVKVGLTLVFSFILYTIFMLITYFIYSLFAPKRYIPPDLPPLKRKSKNDWFF